MSVTGDTLVFIELALVLLSSQAFRQGFTAPRGGSLSPAVVGKRTRRQECLDLLPFPLLIASIEIASLNEFLFILHTQFPPNHPGKISKAMLLLQPHLDALYSSHRNPSESLRGGHTRTFGPFLFLILAITGSLIRKSCHDAFHGTFRFDLAAGGDHRPLITSGPYSIVRHPAYTGLGCIVLGIIGFHLSPGSWIHSSLWGSYPLNIEGRNTFLPVAVGIWIFLVLATQILLMLRMKEEDALLKECFKDEWVRWSKVVRYRLIPGVY